MNYCSECTHWVPHYSYISAKNGEGFWLGHCRVDHPMPGDTGRPSANDYQNACDRFVYDDRYAAPPSEGRD